MRKYKEYAWQDSLKSWGRNLARKWPLAAGGLVSIWMFSAISSCSQKQEIEQHNIDGNDYSIIGPHSVFYEQSDKSKLSFHFDSQTIHIENHDEWDNDVEGFHLRNFAEFPAPDLVEKARQTGCTIADNFNQNRSIYQKELSMKDFKKLGTRLPVFANNYCDDASNANRHISPPDPAG